MIRDRDVRLYQTTSAGVSVREFCVTRSFAIPAVLLLPLFFCGCVTGPRTAWTHNPNPLILAGGHPDLVWERLISVVNDYRFEIARESRLEGVVDTHYRTGAGIFEPWHRDAVGLENRLEGTLQSIRRKAILTVRPTRPGGWAINVQVHKELEDVNGLVARSPGGATFHDSEPLERDLNQVVGQSGPSGWIPLGRDHALEKDMLASIRIAMSG